MGYRTQEIIKSCVNKPTGGDKHGQRKSLRKQSSLSAERKIKKALGGIPKSDFYSGYCVHCNNSDIPFISKLDITETMIGTITLFFSIEILSLSTYVSWSSR